MEREEVLTLMRRDTEEQGEEFEEPADLTIVHYLHAKFSALDPQVGAKVTLITNDVQ